MRHEQANATIQRPTRLQRVQKLVALCIGHRFFLAKMRDQRHGSGKIVITWVEPCVAPIDIHRRRPLLERHDTVHACRCNLGSDIVAIRMHRCNPFKTLEISSSSRRGGLGIGNMKCALHQIACATINSVAASASKATFAPAGKSAISLANAARYADPRRSQSR